MADATQFTMGADATCSDGDCGEVIRVVVDPVARAVTHIVVEPKHRQGLGRLVPMALVDTTTGEVRLRCTVEEFEALDAAEETQFLPGAGGYAGYGPDQVLAWPYYGMHGVMGGGIGMGLPMTDVPQPIIRDTLPLGEVAVRRGERVHAGDGDIGQVQGLVIDPRDHHVTHVLLQEGHLWGRKQVAIPISAVTRLGREGIEVNLSKQEVQDLPPVDLDHPDA